MKPTKLKRHLRYKSFKFLKQAHRVFQRLLKSSKQQTEYFEKFVTVNEKYVKASYEVAYLINKKQKKHIIGEELVLPVAIKITKTVLGKRYSDELKKIPLSNDMVQKRISDISNDLFTQVIGRIKESPKFSIQHD